MQATLCIQARIGQQQPLHRPPMHQMLRHNLLHILHMNKPIPDRIGIHHDHWPMLTLIQAPQLIRPNFPLQPCLFQSILERRLQLSAALPATAQTRSTLIALIGTNKNVMLKLSHFPALLTR